MTDFNTRNFGESRGDTNVAPVEVQTGTVRRYYFRGEAWADDGSGTHVLMVFSSDHDAAIDAKDAEIARLELQVANEQGYNGAMERAFVAAERQRDDAKRECDGLTQDIASWKLTAQRLDDKLSAAKRECDAERERANDLDGRFASVSMRLHSALSDRDALSTALAAERERCGRMEAALAEAAEQLRMGAYYAGELGMQWSATTVTSECQKIKRKLTEAHYEARVATETKP